ncbi:MAG: IPT/TIG domain-containing protein [Candidatus Sericytochromatia bacterium]|nr:IPT/TIG domain-containing protein [Candidatus Tanganyikabacteria bacterium]
MGMASFGTGVRKALITALVTAMAGCALGTSPLGGELYRQPLVERPAGVAAIEADLRKDLTIHGVVQFPAGTRAVQATEAQIVGQSTISMIDPVSGSTLGTGLTDNNGVFALNPVGFSIPDGNTYILEASKGLAGQLPGRNAPRMRTIIKRSGTDWLSITSAATTSVVINAMTTAVALTSGLDPTNVPPGNVMGKVNAAVAPAQLNTNPALSNHPDSEVIKFNNDILAYLTNDFDPVASSTAIKPSITSVNPTAGGVFDPVTIDGSGFHPVTLSDLVVSIGGVAATILMASPRRLIVTVPAGVPAGATTVTVATNRGGTSTGFAFTIQGGGSGLGITLVNPNPAVIGQFVTVTGNGFDANAAANSVAFTGASAVTPVEATPTSLRVAVPAGAITGPVRVTVGANTSNGYALQVGKAPLISSFFPDRGTVKSELRIKGDGFGRRGLGQVMVAGKDANVLAWTDNLIRVEVPWNVNLKAASNYETNPGAVSVQVLTNSGLAISGTWTVLAGEIVPGGGFSNIDSTRGPNGPGTQAWLAGERIIVHGGNGYDNRVWSVGVNNDGSLKSDWRQEVSAPFTMRIDDNPRMTALVGAKRWIMVSNGGNQVMFAKLDPITGDFVGWGDNPANYLPPGWIGKDHTMVSYGWTGIPQADGRGGRSKKVYVLGAGVSCGGCANSGFGMIYADVTEDDNIGPWKTGPSLISFFGEDAWPIVVGNTLYAIGGTDGNARAQYIQLNDDGTPDTSVGWRDSTGRTQTMGSMLSNDPQRVGNYYYTFDTWCDTRCSRSPVILDTYLKGFVSWGSGPTSNCGHTDVPIGRFYYMFGGNGSDRVFQATIS